MASSRVAAAAAANLRPQTAQRVFRPRGLAAAATQNTFDAIIVGAGVMGSSIAFELSKKGMKTLNLEMGLAAGLGSTSASCGIIRTMYSHLDSVKLAHEGYHLWKNWADFIGGHDENGPAGFTEVPAVVPKVEGAMKFINNGLASQAELGIPFEFIDNKALVERFPWLTTTAFGPPRPIDDDQFGQPTGEIDGALVIPTCTGYVSDTILATQNLQRAAEANGAAFRFKAQVQSVLQAGGRVSGVRLASGEEFSAPIVVNASGPWSKELNALAFAGNDIADDSVVRTRPMRVEVAYPPRPAGLERDEDGCVLTDFDVGIYFRPATGGRVCIGSIEPACDPHDDLETTKEFEDYLSEPADRQMYRAGLRVPALPIPNSAAGVSHMYDKSDDFTPIYDKSALGGYYMAIGTSGNQFKNCGVVGQLMGHLIESCENGHDHDADAIQFKLPLSGQVLNTKTFSRLRGTGALATTHSVLG